MIWNQSRSWAVGERQSCSWGSTSLHLKKRPPFHGRMPMPRSMTSPLDHLIIAGPDLAEATDYVESLLGVPASPGGRHLGVGTRNVLVGLGPDAYIEIIGPDPDQPAPARPRWFGIDTLTGPRLVTWAARADDLTRAVATARAAGIELGAVASGGRLRSDGSELTWMATDPLSERLGGVLPFLMDWGRSTHPSAGLAPGCAMVALRGFHPRVDAVRGVADALGLPIELFPGPEPRLEADIFTDSGTITLR